MSFKAQVKLGNRTYITKELNFVVDITFLKERGREVGESVIMNTFFRCLVSDLAKIRQLALSLSPV